MTFFDRKEEVIDFRLTRVGREKLSRGELKPAYYEFFDEGVLYDIAWANRTDTEEQNEASDRIKQGPYIKAQSGFQKAINFKEKRKPLANQYPSLGTFSIFDSYKPAWSIKMLAGQLVTGSTQISYDLPEAAAAAGGSREKVPQLDLRCDYKLRTYEGVDKTDTNSTSKSAFFNKQLAASKNLTTQDVFPKGNENSVMFLKKSFDDFTMLVQEENVLSSSHGFTIEVYKYEYDQENNLKEMKPLYFNDEIITEDSVEWYFNIATDEAVGKTKVTFVDEDMTVKTTEDECVEPGSGG
tara:strand:- start:365 stop:1252 length:888 start_codon:yes stop_codon:yes gene_type:complete